MMTAEKASSLTRGHFIDERVEMTERYDDWVGWYEFNFGDDFNSAVDYFSTRLVPVLKRKKSSGRVLDVGCGIGLSSFALWTAGYDVTGIDISEESLKEAEKHLDNPDVGIRDTGIHHTSIRFEKADIFSYPRPEGGFDAIVAASSFLSHFLEDEQQKELLSKFHQLLAPGGVLLLGMHDYKILMSIDPDDGCTEPSVRQRNGQPLFFFQRRQWFGFPRRREHVCKYYLVSNDEARVVSQRYRAMLPDEVSTTLRDAGMADVSWLMPSETNFYQPLCIAIRHNETEAPSIRRAASLPSLGGTQPPAPGHLPLGPVRIDQGGRDPLAAVPDRRRVMAQGYNERGDRVISRRPRVTLVMLSGGIASTYALLQLLLLTDDEVIAHHIHLADGSIAQRSQAEAAVRIVDHLRSQCRDFLYTESAVDRRQLGAPPDAIMVAGFEAGIVNLSFLDMRGHGVDRWTLGQCREDVDRTAGSADPVALEFALNCAAASCHPHDAPSFFRLPVLSRAEMVEAMGPSLAALCWNCKTPRLGRTGRATPCGECIGCLAVVPAMSKDRIE